MVESRAVQVRESRESTSREVTLGYVMQERPDILSPADASTRRS